MWQFIRSRILTVIIFIGAAHGILVVGPKFIRANQDYTVVISNFNSHRSKVDLMLRMEGRSNDGRSVLNLTTTVDVQRNTNGRITFNMPANLSAGIYKIIVDGQRGFSFHKEAELVHLSKTITGLIQIDKPVYKPGDTVKFRVIVLDSELKPPARVKSIQVTIRDPRTNEIRKWSTAKLYAGVFEGDLQIAPTPMLGIWSISVKLDGEELVSKTFEVKEYVLSSFDVEVIPSVVPLEKHQGLTLTIDANYHFGKPVKGIAKFKVYLINGILDRENVFEVYGKRQVQLQFKDYFQMQEYRQDVIVNTTFIEHATNRTVVKQSDITVYKYMYSVELIKESPQFRSGHPFKCALQFRYHDGTPAKGITGKVEVLEIDYEKRLTSDDEGLIKLELNPSDNTTQMEVVCSTGDNINLLSEIVHRVDVVTNVYLKLELRSAIQSNSILQFMVTCNERMSFFVYYIVSKGNIIDSGYMRLNSQKKFLLKLQATQEMLPKTKLIVATVASRTVVYDEMTIDFKTLRNNFELNIDEAEIKPGGQIVLRMSGRPGAYVGLAAYDKGLLQFSSKHDLFWEDVMQLFDNFHAVNKNEFNVFHSMGLFVKLSGETKLEPMGAKTERFGSPFVPFSNLVHYRTNFLESWLWQNMTIRRDGMLKFSEVVPDTTTSWYLTAFSIDPVHGFGIIKKPIQFTTAQPFYIVENLPYSIKRDETAVLQFTLFNNLEAEYVAEVTLYNVANQTEFIGRPVEDLSYSKTVSVPSKAGAPVSFLVKARKLGEMTVRVKATIMAGREADAVEKVIRVMPENIIVSSSVPRVFNLAKYGSAEYKISLDILKQANFRTIKLEFVLSPNLLTPVVHNLDNLLTVPTASGATSMINFIPNLVVLEYLHAVGSAETVLINKATALLRNGYQFEMQYRQPDGSFGNWRKSTGSIFVTALVGQSMQTASKYILEVDLTMVDQLFDWLASKQHSSGRFEEIAPITYHSLQDGSRNGIALTAFVMIALLENAAATQKHQDVVRRGIQHIVNHLPNITDVYDLSLATYALMLNGHSQKRTAIDLLIEKSQPVQGSDGKQRYWPRDTAAIETAAYGLLSLVHDKRYLDGISVMQWLVNQREATGSFPHTQDTFVGLKAISMLAAAVSPSKNDYTVSVQHGRTRKVYKMASMEVNRQFRDELTGEDKTVTVGVHGRGFGLFEIKYRYGIDVRYVNKQFSLRLEPHFSNANHVLQLKVCTNFTPVLTHSRSNLAQVEVNFPSGYIVDRDSMVDITRRNPVKNVEFHYGYTSMVVYYYSLGPEDNCFMVTAERLFRVAFQRPAYVLVHDSYHNLFRAIKAYEAPQDRCVDCH
ncbi:thioester-containing protein 1 allele S3-like [Anopheles moucheti]|uniref:thioester-containing protein 1 allele S3-like n=1 Tax=Anopheles moucheti TaxID=186751 RepID=UPI0022F0EB90|nr:thioester-containing protein 1 allele S3-like [Anopheles moucheti]